MKVLMFVLSLFAVNAISATTPIILPDEDQSVDLVAKALNEGDVNTLANYLDATVDITVVDREDSYDKAGATKILRDFFGQKPKSFTQMHSGAPKGKDAQYVIGNLQMNSGNYRVYVYMKTVAGKTLIQEMRFEKA